MIKTLVLTRRSTSSTPISPGAWQATRASSSEVAGTDVSLQIRFFKIESVDLATGKLRVRVWWRMS